MCLHWEEASNTEQIFNRFIKDFLFSRNKTKQKKTMALILLEDNTVLSTELLAVLESDGSTHQVKQ